MSVIILNAKSASNKCSENVKFETSNFKLNADDAYEGRCGEIYISEKRHFIYHCSLCDNKYDGIIGLLKHITSQHYAVKDQSNKKDINFWKDKAATTAAPELLSNNCSLKLENEDYEILEINNYIEKEFDLDLTAVKQELADNPSEQMLHLQTEHETLRKDKSVKNIAVSSCAESKSKLYLEMDSTFPTILEFTTEHLKQILSKHEKGNMVQKFYEHTQYLLPKHRDVIINAILENKYRCLKLRPEHFACLAENIVELFPTETKEFYYTPRKPKGNPTGKLYSKYYNLKKKRRKICQLSEEHIIEFNKKQQQLVHPAADDHQKILNVMELQRLTLLHDNADYDSLNVRWMETFDLRKIDLQSLLSMDIIFERWQAYTNAYGNKLIEIDFNMMHPSKSNLLNQKWTNLSQSLLTYFNDKIKDADSRAHLKTYNLITNSDSKIYIICMLLNTVLPPRNRFPDDRKGKGKNKRKGSIADAQMYFIIHVTDISEISQRISDFKCSYYADKSLTHPYIIAQGPNIYDLNNFYIHFNNILYNIDSLLKAIDICFKIFRVFMLKFPSICFDPWSFLQKYVYEIDSQLKDRASTVLNLISYLTTYLTT